jgi:2-phospho-L-lactate guanylyltransferase
MPAVTAIVPLKALAEAKGRLAPDVGPAGRLALTEAMFRHVVAACRSAPTISDVLVVAGDVRAADLAETAGVRWLLVPTPGLAVALEAADRAMAGSAATLVVAADLPVLSVGDLEAICAAIAPDAPEGRSVVVAPTRDGGTGGLLRVPGGVIPTAFGPGSARAHERHALAAGIDAIVLDREGFALDLDTPGQLRALADAQPDLLRFVG